MSVFLAIPTKKDPAGVAAAVAPWREQGYRIALFRDAGDAPAEADLIISAAYHGYPRAANDLCRAIFAEHPDVDWVCVAGDDMLPPHVAADPLGLACSDYFGGTFGIMQATGDPMGLDAAGLCAAERICGSPFVGREFCERWNGGAGPFWPEYHHYYADEECREVALAAGLLWQRKDLTIWHNHWHRTGAGIPSYMQKAQDRWGQDEAMFQRRKATGFPGHRPLVLVTT